MNKSHWLVASAFAGCAVLLACSSTSSGGGNTNYGSYTSCLAQGASSDCVSCVESNCGTPLSNVESSCTDFLNCGCPGGTYSDSAWNSSACEAKLTGNQPCVNANDGFGSCVTSSCATQCGTTPDGGTDDSSTSGDTGTTGDGAAAVACGIGYAAASCASCVTTNCCTQSNACGGDSACLAIIACQQACSATDTTCINNCVTNASSAAQNEYNNLGSCLQMQCTNNGC